MGFLSENSERAKISIFFIKLTPDGERVERDGLLVLLNHFDGTQMRVHCHVDAHNRACKILFYRGFPLSDFQNDTSLPRSYFNFSPTGDERAVLELDGDRLVREFHQESHQFHFCLKFVYFHKSTRFAKRSEAQTSEGI